ncbi:putative methylase with S-adenosyl-L-methionine-dependent methyltransferase domain and alpha/beta-hydrolase domain [Xenorhabdus bovienii str. oregonense]|uniref:Putative methylase with S-adenosyl-L-methionine-dependent methyltransferase domain and alpha/beta-hydrolase domain n=1 Tax=Xenorhabdus bovienii str. oregonense TaxID=1398202 RepID=A0A077P2S0_XENBV|nr:bifunctional alpha/beta hydrolase/class I SAM-dependent methyltransferase [Xenorhabdus bovienii]CDH04106.1 putative methylase with S-adenosyl-L-methionine-dependent methyltransferase domain and alpha/beta-hydrolase domain [Xenorhabdus bovienii str. oregonense]
MTPQLDQRIAEEHYFTTSDNASLFYRYWPQQQANPDRAIIIFHRGHEHSGRIQHAVDGLDLPDVPMFAWDARGHGKTEGPRGYSPSMGTSIRDVDEFVRFIATQYGIAMGNIVVIGQSVGAVLVSAWVHDYAPKIRAMILAAPAFDIKLYIPFATQGLQLMQKARGIFFVNSYVKARYLTHDETRIASYNSDPLITREIAVNILLDLYQTAERVVKDAAAITLPTLLFISGSDYVVNKKPQHQFYQQLNTPIKEKHVMDGFYHDTLGEKDRHLVFDKIRVFIERIFALPRYQHDYSREDTWSHSADEFRTLGTSLPSLCPKKLSYQLMRKVMNTRWGRASEGVGIGLKTGFDSGSTLDYVYRNQPQGKGILGRMLDKHYLNSIGWRGIRQRKIHIEMLIRHAIRSLREQNMPVHMVDIAAGHGRYILDAINDFSKVDSILLRDYSEINVNQGQAYIEERDLTDKIRFVIGDAFNAESIASITPAPTLGIVSGLYELFPDNNLLRNSLRGFADVMTENGYLVYTGQPWHPQIEVIARVLSSHRDNQPWIMRRRTQGEMDALVEAAGFEKLYQLTDNWGIFTVSIAKRVHR